MKKGQITIFIILGIVILIVIGGVFYASKITRKAPSTTPAIATDQVNSCLGKVTEEGIYLMSSQGGYLNPKGDEKYGEEGDGEPAHYYLGNSILPYVLNGQETTFREIPMQLIEKYVELELPKCFNWSAFPGYEVTMEEPDVTVTTRETGTLVSANYSIQFSKEGESFTIDKFSADIPLRVELLQKTAKKLLENVAQAHANSTPYNLFQHCEEYDSEDSLINIYSTLNPYSADYAIVIVDALPARYGRAPLKYQFAIRNVIFGGLCVG